MSGHLYILSPYTGLKIVTVDPVTSLGGGHGLQLTFGTARFHKSSGANVSKSD